MKARVATTDVSRQIPGILTHDGGLSYVVDVVLSMLLQWEEFRSFSLASVGLPREMARAGVLTASGLRWQNHSAPLPTPCGKSEAPTRCVL